MLILRPVLPGFVDKLTRSYIGFRMLFDHSPMSTFDNLNPYFLYPCTIIKDPDGGRRGFVPVIPKR